MKCCVDCFSDEAVRELVARFGESDEEETCGYCGGAQGPFCEPEALGDTFRRVIDDNYVPVDQLSNARHIDAFEEGEELGMALDEDFGVFADSVLDERERLLADIIDTGDREDDGYPDGLWARKEQDWTHWSHAAYYSDFAQAAKKHGHSLITPRRTVKGGHTIEGSVGVIRQSIEALSRVVVAGTKGWRARVGENLTGKMGAPPAPLAAVGRINKVGEPVLYLCLDKKTPIAEVRPSIGDTVSVQGFEICRDLKVCDFTRGRDACEPFVETEEAFAEYQRISTRNQIRNEIGAELARPVRRGDEATEYLPTQLVATFARELGFDALMFSSTQREGGINLVLFDSDDARSHGQVREHEIQGVSYRKRPKARRVVAIEEEVEDMEENDSETEGDADLVDVDIVDVLV